jgi:Tfp pilus assembly protein PilO
VNPVLQQILGFFRRYPFVIACTALSIVLWVANYFILQKRLELIAGHQTLQRNGEDMLQSLTNHSRVSTELGAVKDALAFINQNLVNEGDLPENMGYFYQIETAARLRLQALNQLSSMPPPAEHAYKTVPFTLRTTGSYRQILRFLRELETGPRLYKVQTYSITQGGSASTPASRGGEAAAAPAPEVTLITLDMNVEMLARP